MSDAPRGEAEERLVQQALAKMGPAVVRPAPLFDLLDVPPNDAAAVVAAVQRDPTLAARVLSVTNSAAFGLVQEVTSVPRAVMLLGPSRARAIAMAYGLRSLSERWPLPRRILDTLWANSLQKACAAQRLCRWLAPEQAETAYCLGLVQDIGLPVMVAMDPPYYENHVLALLSRVPWVEHERERFGFDHGAVGRALLAKWRSGGELQRLVRHHHSTPPIQGGGSSGVSGVSGVFGGAAHLQIASFLAGLLPHMDEEPAPAQLEWLHALHAQFLAGHVASPDEFLRQVAQEAAALRGRDVSTESPAGRELFKRLVHDVASNTVSITAKLCRLEHRLRREREGMTDLKFQAFTDPLTKVLNRRGLAQLGQRRLKTALEQRQGVCCMVGDIDEFKAINDAHGHEVGDQVLRGLAKVMRRQLGPSDLIGRLGGDEFAVLVADVDEAMARALAGRMVEAVVGCRLRVRAGLEVEVTFSLGVVFIANLSPAMTLDELLTLADRAMYERKKSGKRGLFFSLYPPPEGAALADANPQPRTRTQPRV